MNGGLKVTQLGLLFILVVAAVAYLQVLPLFGRLALLRAEIAHLR